MDQIHTLISSSTDFRYKGSVEVQVREAFNNVHKVKSLGLSRDFLHKKIHSPAELNNLKEMVLWVIKGNCYLIVIQGPFNVLVLQMSACDYVIPKWRCYHKINDVFLYYYDSVSYTRRN